MTSLWLVPLTILAFAGCATVGTPAPVAAPTPPRDRSFLVPAVEIVAMSAAVNLVGRQTRYAPDLQVSLGSIRRNLSSRWVVDHDPYEINQLAHPYQGATYHGMARSSGLNYWQAAAYTFAGSALWEIAGERTTPSKNDQITTALAGPFLGESLFKLARRLAHPAGVERSTWWRRLGAVVVSPPSALNHAMFGHRYDDPPEPIDAATDARLELGVTTLTGEGDARWSPRLRVAVDYTQPRDAAGRFAGAFEDFRFEVAGSSAGIDMLSTRGILGGRRHGTGAARSVWGLLGSYDYFAPDGFGVSSAGAMIGAKGTWTSSTASWSVAGTAAIGAGYAATSPPIGSHDRVVHYGVAPQGVVNLRVRAGGRWSFDATTREYVLDGSAAIISSGVGSDVITHSDATLAFRLFDRHGVALKYVQSRRDLGEGAGLTRRSSLGLFYTLLSVD